MNTFSQLWFNYFWPSLKGNGPEALVQTVVYGLIAIVFVPPIRRWFKAHLESIHAKVDHLILHSSEVPNEVPGLPAEHQPRPVVSPATPPHESPDPS